jgi:hypothetical protein
MFLVFVCNMLIPKLKTELFQLLCSVNVEAILNLIVLPTVVKVTVQLTLTYWRIYFQF